MADTFPAEAATMYRALLEATALREARRLQPALTTSLTDEAVMADPIVSLWIAEAYSSASRQVSGAHTTWIHQQVMAAHGLTFVDGPTNPPDFPPSVPAEWEARLLSALLLGLDAVVLYRRRGDERIELNLRPFVPSPDRSPGLIALSVPAWQPRR